MGKKMAKTMAKTMGTGMMAVLLGISGITGTCVTAFAEEETEVLTAEAETDLTDETESENAEPVEMELVLDDGSVTVTNATGISLSDLTLQAEDADGEDEESSDTESVAAMLTFTDEDETEHAISIADVSRFSELTGLELTTKIGFFFLSGTDASGEEVCFYESADEITLDAPVTMYTVGTVNIRESADGSSEAVGYVDRGSELQVLGGTSSWFLVSVDDVTGYVAARYLTTDEAEAQAAVDANDNAAAAAAAAAAASSSASGSSGTQTTTDDACLTGGVLY